VLRDEIAQALADGGRGERLRDGLVVAIAGAPNAGKSTLLNRFARREAAIVSPYAGTTRDVIEVHLDLGGYPVTLLDTAGIRESADPVEQEGVRRARERAAEADLVLWLVDTRQPDWDVENFDEMARKPDIWVVKTKLDLAVDNLCIRSEQGSALEPRFSFSVSAVSGAGMDALDRALSGYAAEFFAATEAAIVTRIRHRRALEATVAALDRALAQQPEADEAIVAEELRAATTALGRLTGRVDVEDVLDVIFRDFCIGK
jgi:tRNA modification GTPase